jgi:outer membrane receptor protein involved in Fe transport
MLSEVPIKIQTQKQVKSMQKLLRETPVSVRRFIIVIVCTGFVVSQAFSNSIAFGQVRISFSLQSASVEQALEVVRERSGIGITYNNNDLPGDKRITCDVKDITVADALNFILQKTNLGYKEYKSNFVIYVKPPVVKAVKTTGSIKGTIADAESGEPLIGASVLIVGTSWGASADAEGSFIIKDVPAGIYQLAFSYLGYESAIVRDIKITAGETTTLDYKLKPSSTTLQDIVIIGDKALSGNVVETNEVSLLNSIRSSSLIITGISAQQISRSVDQDAADVARRLPGVTVLNNFVSIRGMQERYNLTFLNGMIAPSSEADRRAFSYDMLPSNMIDKMTVYRSPGPELLSDFAGGVIKIETKNTSIARQLEVNVSTWYRPDSNLEKYYTYDGGGKDWLGKDDGTRALPKGFPETAAIPAGGLGSPANTRDISGYTADELAANANWAKQLYHKWNLQKANAGMDYRAGINYYNAWRLGGVRLSNLTSINTTQATQIVRQDFKPLRIAEGNGKQRDIESYRDTISQVTARWGLLQNLSLIVSPRHSFELKGIYNRLGIDETIVRDGLDLSTDYNSYLRKITYTYRSREILATQLAGNHTLSANNSHTIQWSGSYSFANDDVPAQRSLLLLPINPQDQFPEVKRYVSGNASNPFTTVNSLFYSSGEERNTTFTLDYLKKYESSGLFFKAGFFNENKEKDIDSRLIAIGGEDIYYEGARVNEYEAEKIFRPEAFKEDGTGAYIFDNEYLSGIFNVKGKIYAGYGSVNIPLIQKKLQIYGGLRYEGQDLHLRIPPSEYLESAGYKADLINRYVDYWLPSVNVTWSFSDKMLLRAAYGKTLNRPNYRELIPITVLDPRLDNMSVGNDTLQDAQIHNFDLRWELYPSESEFVSVGAFYKRLNNAIEPYAYSEGSREIIRYDNTPEAEVYGVEVEVRKNLGFIPVNWSRRFSAIANLALLKSEVKFKDGLFPSQGNDFDDFRIVTRPLEGTASYVVNLGLYFDQEDWGTKVSALYNVLGQRLVYAGTSFFPETYELPRHVVDLVVRQRLTKYLELKAGVQDLLNQPRRLYRDYDRNQYWDDQRRTKLPNKDWMFQEYRPGSYFMLGLNLTL